MFVLVTYDVNTVDKAGRRRLRRVARCCMNYGQRVQYSVFECLVGDKEWAQFRHDLLADIDETSDSLRFYFLDELSVRRIEHHGVREPRNLSDPLIV